MKHSLLPLFGMAFAAASANAQSWTAPVPAFLDGPTDDTEVLIYNVDASMFVTAANAWGTQVSVSSTHASTFLLNDSTTTDDASLTGWTLAYHDSTTYNGSSVVDKWGLYTFRNDESTGYVDMGSQGNNFFSFEKQDNGYYRIRNNAGNATYGSENENYDYQYWGYVDGLPATLGVVTFNADPTQEDHMIDWAFVDPSEFDLWSAKRTLYDALVNAEDQGVDLDLTEYSSVYASSSDIDELNATTSALNEAVNAALLGGASEDNPADMSSLLTNPAFDTGDITGWTCTFVSGTNATNVGYQSASYTNGDVTISGFIEAWAAAGTSFSSATSTRGLGVGELSQTLSSLPAGKYQLGIDVIANNQDGETVTGVQLFATGGDLDSYQTVSTGNGAPEHFDVVFYSSGGDVTVGLRTVDGCTANWIAADNFTLTYYGETEEDVYKLALESTIEQYEATYDDLDGLMANQEVIDAYSAALEAAKSATDDYSTYSTALTEAADALALSVSEYEDAAEEIENINDAIDTATESNWDELLDTLGNLLDEIQQGYDEKTLTSEDISNIASRKSTLIGDYISAYASAGDDVSILLNNPGFDTGFSGWDVDEDGATPAWGGMDVENGEGTGSTLAEINSGNAEVYHAAFDISQTIKSMPVGMYTLSCQAFERDDNGSGVEAELYAVMNGEEQTQTIKSLYDEGSEDVLYQETGDTSWDTSLSATLTDGTTAYVPNTMCGANVYFAAGYYKNSFNIIVTEVTDITVGIRTASTGDWVLFDDFKLVYQGNDASVYADYIQELINTAGGQGDNGVLTAEAETVINDAIAAGEDAIDGGTSDDCVAAIAQLQEAIAFAQTTIALVNELEDLAATVSEDWMGSIESSDEALPALVEEVLSKIDNQEFETNEEVSNYISSLKSGWTAYVQYDYLETATEEEPADITAVILNPNGVDDAGEGSTDYWDSNSSPSAGEGCTELYNVSDSAYVSQTIYGLAPGYYVLGVQGLYRGTGYISTIAAGDTLSNDTLVKGTLLFADDATTYLARIADDAEAYNALDANEDETLWNVPTSMATANTAFENGLYQNYLLFEVKEGQESVTIGLQKTYNVSADWLIWDNWTLQYLGTTAPENDPTTAIKEIEAAGVAGTTEIYSIGGTKQSRLLKGVNIIKTTAADGTVKIQKVLVR